MRPDWSAAGSRRKDDVPMRALWPSARPRLGARLAILLIVVASAIQPALAAPEDTAARLAAAVRPTLDPIALATRLQGRVPGPSTVEASQRTTANVGQFEHFVLLDQTQTPNVLLDIEAELRLVTPHAYWYLERGRPLDADALAAGAAGFEAVVY